MQWKIDFLTHKFAVGPIDMGSSESQNPLKPKIVNKSLGKHLSVGVTFMSPEGSGNFFLLLFPSTLINLYRG